VGTYTYDGTQRIVSITPKAEKSPGTVTVYYSGSTTAPSAVGSYTVTFNVASATGWNAASGLSAGTLTINSSSGPNQTPIASDYNISGIGTFTADGTARVVTVTAKSGKSPGTVTVYYSGSTTAPSAAGTYTVTFNVAAATGWNAVSGLSAGTLIINASDNTPTFTSISAFRTWLNNQSSNSPANAYNVKLNLNDLTGIVSVLQGAPNKCVKLDLSGSTITSIPDLAFSGGDYGPCETLIGIIIPNSVTSIGDNAFESCENLTSVVIPNSVISIGEAAFVRCFGLVNVAIPNGVKSIGYGAFLECSSLASINISSSVISIGEDVFLDCYSLATINVDSGNSVYSSESGILYNKNKTLLILYPQGRTVSSFTIPNSVTSIGESAFDYCTSLSSVTIPNSVTSIGSLAFGSCTSLTSITIPNSVTNIGVGAFWGCTKLSSINVDSGNNAYTSENGILYNKNKTALIQYPYGKTVTSFTIPSGVTNIGEGAFWGCSLIGITIPDSVTSIERMAFRFCFSFTNITIPSSVINIGSLAFDNCRSLTSVTFQGTIPSSGFGSSAFYGDLRTKFYATDAANGTPGTYTRASSSTLWYKQ
jgi:hypothetical protein